MARSNRREFIRAAGLAAVAGLALPRAARATPEAVADLVAGFTGGAEASGAGIALAAPEIAENGNTVPISVSVDSPQDAGHHVRRILVLADGNPNPGVATFRLTALSGRAEVSTRMRLAQTQGLVAVAEMSDGSFRMAEKEVKVTIGGCGG